MSPRSVKSAKKLLDSGNAELIEKVEQGKATLNAALKEIEPPKPTKAKPSKSAKVEPVEIYEDVEDDDESVSEDELSTVELMQFMKQLKAIWEMANEYQRGMITELMGELEEKRCGN